MDFSLKKKGNDKPGSRVTIWSSTFIALCIVSLFQAMSQQMMNTILPLYVREMGMSSGIIGFVVGAFAITALLVRPFAAPAFDSFSKKKILFIASLVMVLASFLYGVSETVPMLVFVRLLHGLAMGCTGPLALALVTDSVPIEKTASGVGMYSLAQALSQAVGPAMGLFLIDIVGYRWTFWISTITMVVATLLVLTVKEKRRANRPKYKIALNRMFAKDAIMPTIVVATLSMTNTGIMSFLAIYAGLMGIEAIGLYFTVHALVMVVSRPLFGALADRIGYNKVIIPSLVIYAFAFVIIANADSLWMFILAGVITAVGFGTASPLMQAMCMASVPRDRSGAAGSTNFTGFDIAMLIGPIITGSLADFFYRTSGSELVGYSNMYLATIVICVIGIVLYLLFAKTMNRNMARVARLEQQHAAEAAAAEAEANGAADVAADEVADAAQAAETIEDAAGEVADATDAGAVTDAVADAAQAAETVEDATDEVANAAQAAKTVEDAADEAVDATDAGAVTDAVADAAQAAKTVEDAADAPDQSVSSTDAE